VDAGVSEPGSERELPPFIPGLELSERFFRTAVQPLLERRLPRLHYAAAHLGRGSDVIGFDTPQSRDHHWGPKVTLFLEEEDCRALGAEIGRLMGDELPFTVDGYPTHFDTPDYDGGILGFTERRPISHGVTVTTIAHFTTEYLGVDATAEAEIDELAWLAIPSQRLRTIRSGRVFHDDIGLAAVRQRLHWYPRDIWLYRLANGWRRIDQEEPWVGRCGDVGDALGSRIIATRLAVELMRLCFLMEREYAPYFKWFGTAFSRLECAAELGPILAAVLDAPDWRTREDALGKAYLVPGRMHNALGITETVEPRLAPFFGRPYQVPHAQRYVQALRARIESPRVLALPPYVGAVDQFTDSTDVLDDLAMVRGLTGVYRGR
jgi:hypothetical protein